MIVAVTGGKGGVGKSTIAWNLGRQFEAVVVDADLATPDLPHGHRPDLHDVLSGRATAVEAVETVASIAVLPAGRTLAGARACDLSVLPNVFEQLTRQFGRVIVDCPPGLAQDVGVILDGAAVAVLVTLPEKSSIQDALRTRQLSETVRTPVACVAINRAPDGTYSKLIEKVEDEFGAPATVLREEPVLAEAQAEWTPLREYAPETSTNETFEWLAAQLETCEHRVRKNPGNASHPLYPYF